MKEISWFRGVVFSVCVVASPCVMGLSLESPVENYGACECCDPLLAVAVSSESSWTADSYSAATMVRYIDGVPTVTIGGIGLPSDMWAFMLSYVNRSEAGGATAFSSPDLGGYSWIGTVPRLVTSDSDKILVAGGRAIARYTPLGSGSLIWWDKDESTYTTLTHAFDGGYEVFRLDGARGGYMMFHYTGTLAGRVYKIVRPGGEYLQFSYFTSGMYAGRVSTVSDSATLHQMTFSYNSTTGWLDTVWLRLGSSWLSYMGLSHYTSDIPFVGSVGDLATVSVIREYGASPAASEFTYLRYYTGDPSENGNQHDLKFIVSPDNYEKVVDINGATSLADLPDSAFETDFLYDARFEYYTTFPDDLQRRVQKAKVLHTGSCGSCGGGGGGTVGEYTFEYAVLPRPGPFALELPYVTVRETAPDGSVKVVQVNCVGAALKKVVREAGISGGQWAWIYAHKQRLSGLSLFQNFTFYPSACDTSSYNAGGGEWADMARVEASVSGGFFDAVSYTYYTTWQGVPYAYSGALAQRDEGRLGGASRTVVKNLYDAQSENGKFFYPWKTLVYPTQAKTYSPVDDQTPETNAIATTFWYSFSYLDVVTDRIVTFPAITKPGAQASCQRTEAYWPSGAAAGKLRQVQDEETRVSNYEYDTNGRLTRVYVDTNGLNLRQDFEYDQWGRGVKHKVFDSAGSAIQIQRWVYSGLSAGVYGDGYVNRRVRLFYDQFDESQGDLSKRSAGVIHISVVSMQNRMLEEATGHIDSNSSMSDDFLAGTTALDAAFAGELLNRSERRYQNPQLRLDERWLNAEQAAMGKYTGKNHLDLRGQVAVSVDAVENMTRFGRDVFGRVRSVGVGVGSDPENTVTAETASIEYDDGIAGGDGLITQAVYPLSNSERVVRYGYDDWNRTTSVAVLADSGEPNGLWDVTVQEYDNLDRVTKTVSFLSPNSAAPFSPYYSAERDGQLWAQSKEVAYDERGRPCERTEYWQKVQQGGTLDAPGTLYTSRAWYDRRGLVIKMAGPGVVFVKYSYDGAGRRTGRFRGFDVDETVSYTEAGGVSDDWILDETWYQYDESGRLLFSRSYERRRYARISGADVTGLGSLSGLSINEKTGAFLGRWYDRAGWLTAEVDYGKNGGATDMTARPTDPGTPSDTQLVTTYTYKYRTGSTQAYSGQPSGQCWVEVTRPDMKKYCLILDNLGREVRQIRNYMLASNGGMPYVNALTPPQQENVTSEFVYDGLDRVVQAIAYELTVNGDPQKQLTEYEYGAVTGLNEAGYASEVNSKYLLNKIRSGDITGAPTYFREAQLTYNRQGDLKSHSVRDIASGAFRTKREFLYNDLGRIRLDSVAEVDASVEASVRSIEYAFDSAGRLVEIGSYSGLDGSGEDHTNVPLNCVTWTYDAHGNLSAMGQDHGHPAFGSKSVGFYYSNDSGFPVPRLAAVTYPAFGQFGQPRVVDYYRDKGGSDLLLQDWAIGRASKIADFKEGEAGNAMRGEVCYEYMGFANIIRMTYGVPVFGVPETQASLGFYDGQGLDNWNLGFDQFGRVKRMYSVKNGHEYVDLIYGYDRLGNPLSRVDGSRLAEQGNSGTDTFAYDCLSRLVSWDPFGANNTKTWKLSSLANWVQVMLNGTVAETRAHDAEDKIVTRMVGSITKPFGASSYDGAGNLQELPSDNAVNTNQKFLLSYDAWNRLAKVKYDSTTLAEYRRDGLGRIVEEVGAGKHYYYNSSWQLLSVVSEASSGTILKEYLPGVAYVDEHLGSVDYSSGTPTRRYYMQDANWNVVTTVDRETNPHEMITYDVYGRPTFYNWIDPDYCPNTTPYGGAVSSKGTDHLFQGRQFTYFQYQPLKQSVQQARLYDFRNRTYSPTLGRFLQKDPIGVWGDATNLGNALAFEGGAPGGRLDPMGLRLLMDDRKNPKMKDNLAKALGEICPCFEYGIEQDPKNKKLSKMNRQMRFDYVGKDKLGQEYKGPIPQGYNGTEAAFCCCYYLHSLACNWVADLLEDTTHDVLFWSTSSPNLFNPVGWLDEQRPGEIQMSSNGFSGEDLLHELGHERDLQDGKMTTPKDDDRKKIPDKPIRTSTTYKERTGNTYARDLAEGLEMSVGRRDTHGAGWWENEGEGGTKWHDKYAVRNAQDEVEEAKKFEGRPEYELCRSYHFFHLGGNVYRAGGGKGSRKK